MEVTVEWSNGQVEELDVALNFMQLLDKIGNPLTIQTYMKSIWGLNIPPDVQVPADLQVVFQNFFRHNTPREKWPSLNQISVIDEWFAWQRVLLALDAITPTVEQWNDALIAGTRILNTNFVAQKSTENARLGSEQRKKKVRRDVMRRIQRPLDGGETDKRKLAKIYRDSFANENNKPIDRKALGGHLDDILDGSGS